MEYCLIDVEAFLRALTIEYSIKMLVSFTIGIIVGLLIAKIKKGA